MRKLLGVLTEKLIVTEPPSTVGGRFYYLSPQWHAIVWGLLEMLDNPDFWENSEDGLNWLHMAMATGECLECGDNAPPPQSPPPPKIIYIDREIDDENGDDDNMCKCPNSVHYDAENKAFYYLDANCNRVPIPAFAPNPTANVDDLEESGGGGIAEGVDTVHDNPLYKTMDSLKCAKATALVNEFWRIADFGNTLEDVVVYSQVVASIAGIYAIVTPEPTSKTIAAGLAAAAIGMVNEFGLEDWRDDLLYVYDDVDGKDELICTLVQQMSAPVKLGNVLTINRMTVDDVAKGVAAFAAQYADYPLAVKMLKAMSVSGLIEATQFIIAETDCGCVDYEPVTPPVDPALPPDDGCIKVYPAELCLAPYDGQNMSAPLSYWTGFELFGTHGDGVYITGAAGNNGAGADLFRVGALFEISAGAQIIEVRWDWSSAPYVQGTDGRTYQFSVYAWANSAANSVVSYDVTVTGGTGATVTVPVSGDWVTRSHVAIGAFCTASTGNPNQVKMRNVQFRIKSIADGFDGWVSAGQNLCD